MPWGTKMANCCIGDLQEKKAANAGSNGNMPLSQTLSDHHDDYQRTLSSELSGLLTANRTWPMLSGEKAG